MKKRYLIIVLIFAGLLISYFYDPSMNSLARKSTISSGDRPISFYMKDMETRTFNNEGIHTNTISSIFAFQMVNSDQINLEQPVMMIALNASPWVANANTGITSDNMKKISLKNDVLLSRIDGIADITTDVLVFDSKRELAYTRSPVKILARGSKTTATGIRIDLNKETIQLRKNVKTYYAPEPKKPGNAPALP